MQIATRPAPAKPPVSAEAVLATIEPGARAHRCKDLLIYLHVPFCSSKCHFCDWVVGYPTADLVAKGGLRQAYVDALVRQISWYGPRLSALGYRPTHLYWGGGTPTRLSAPQLDLVNRALADAFDLRGLREFTLEGSPETVTDEKLEVLRRHGLSRISIGVQSFDDAVLRKMGRSHDADTARQAIARVRAAGLTHFNVDLITGFADQSSQSALASIRTTAELLVPHVTVYLFRTLSENLVSVRQVEQGHRNLAEPEARYDCVMESKQALEQVGYHEYARSYYARSEAHRFDAEDFYFSSRGDFVGFGAGAHSTLGRHLLSQSPHGETVDVHRYIADPLSQATVRPAASFSSAYLARRLMVGLYARDGVSTARWRERYGVEVSALLETPEARTMLETMQELGGVFERSAERLALTPETWIPTLAAFNAAE